MLPDAVTESDQAVTELGQAGHLLLAELEAAHVDKADAEARIERVKGAIQVLMENAGATTATVGGQPAVTWRPVLTRRFDQATAKRFLTPEQAEACMVTVESRPFRRAS